MHQHLPYENGLLNNDRPHSRPIHPVLSTWWAVGVCRFHSTTTDIIFGAGQIGSFCSL